MHLPSHPRGFQLWFGETVQALPHNSAPAKTGLYNSCGQGGVRDVNIKCWREPKVQASDGLGAPWNVAQLLRDLGTPCAPNNPLRRLTHAMW
jgi:hypothetical protein